MKAIINFYILLIDSYLVKTSYLLKGTIFFFHEHQAQEFGTVNICAL